MKKIIILALVTFAIFGVILGVVFSKRIDRIRTTSALFSGAEQYENFPRMYEMFPSAKMPASTIAHTFANGTPITLPETYLFEGEAQNLQSFLTETDTSALLVLKNGSIVFEQYWLTGGRDVPWLSMSVAKSFISALVGIAISDGLIDDIEDPITNYVPALQNSAYDGVSIKDILQMSSGARWNEDYSDPKSDINRFGRIFALGGSLNEFAATLPPENEPGTFNRYNSTDTQALGMLLLGVTNRSITDYMNEKLWQPMGAEYPGYWLLDDEGMEMAFAGLNVTARDYAKIGELYRLGGRLSDSLGGKQIVPEAWVIASVTPDAPHLQPGKNNPASDFELGYGYQWWVPEGQQGEFSAIGVYNQFVFVNPTTGTVIVKLSANSDYGITNDQTSYREIETIEMFRAIADLWND